MGISEHKDRDTYIKRLENTQKFSYLHTPSIDYFIAYTQFPIVKGYPKTNKSNLFFSDNVCTS